MFVSRNSGRSREKPLACPKRSSTALLIPPLPVLVPMLVLLLPLLPPLLLLMLLAPSLLLL